MTGSPTTATPTTTSATRPPQHDPHPLTPRRLAAVTVLRLVGFGAAQALLAGGMALAGSADPWGASAAWWPVTASAVNLVTLGVLHRLLRAEGRSLRDLYRVDRSRWGRDLPAALVVTLLGGVLAAAPNLGLATALWGDPQTSLDLLVRPLPTAAAVAALALFPTTTALAELPTYYGYVQPRLARLGTPVAAVVGIPAVAHALQHMALPVLPDVRFVVWRALMFMPFALLLGAVLRRRPSLLPYLVVVHLLLDLQMAGMVLGASR